MESRLFTFRDRVLLQLKAVAQWKNTSIYGLITDTPLSNGDTATATFWYVDNEIMAVLTTSAEGFTTEVLEIAISRAECHEQDTPEEGKGFSAAVVAVPGDYLTMEAPNIDGYVIWDLFGFEAFGCFLVYREPEKEMNR